MGVKIGIDLETGKQILILDNGSGGGSSTEIALLSITIAPSGSFAVGSKYYDSTEKKIYTAVTADTWVGATSADPEVNTIYTYDSGYYKWDGDNLVSTDVDAFIKGATVNGVSIVDANKIAVIPNASNTVIGASRFATDGEVATGTAENLAVNPKQLKDGLDSVSCGSNIPFSIKSANIGDKGEVDLFNISTKIVNSGCSFTGSVATGGANKYVRLLETAPISTADSWVINVPKFNYTSVGSSGGALNGYSGSLDCQVPLLLIDSATNHLQFFASSEGSTWNIFNAEDTGLTLSTATDYYIRLSYDSVNGYEIEYSTDGVNYTSAWTSATTTKPYCNSPFMFMNLGLNTANYFVAGTMDFATGSITIDSIEWWNGADLSNSLTFKVDDGTSYAPLKVIGIDGQEHTFNTLSVVDVSSIADGEIKIVITETGAEARKNKIFVQTAEPTPENDGDIWVKGNEAFDWDNSESEWITSTVIAVLGVITKNGVIENGYCFPLNYNGKSEMDCFSYLSDVVEYDLVAKNLFRFYGIYKDNLKAGNIPVKHPVKFSKFYDTNYSGITAGGITETNSIFYILATSTDIFGFYGSDNKMNNIILQGYLTKN